MVMVQCRTAPIGAGFLINAFPLSAEGTMNRGFTQTDAFADYPALPGGH